MLLTQIGQTELLKLIETAKIEIIYMDMRCSSILWFKGSNQTFLPFYHQLEHRIHLETEFLVSADCCNSWLINSSYHHVSFPQ